MNVSSRDEIRILEKAAYIEEALTVLARKQALDAETCQNNREERAIVEREFQTAIEACLDIAGILIVGADAPMPETYAGRFTTLYELDLLSHETSERMRQAAGFRNVLAHNYGSDIDDTAVYRHLQTELEWFVRYLREIKDVLEHSSAENS
ncbi:type VII toxin-antitoxin system HepT family RNase toxin [Natrialbaceae archaeon A-chndr2]